jgi:amino acid adenylation domain-containing protein
MSWLSARVEQRLAECGDRPAVDSGNGKLISYSSFRGITGAIARQLSGRGPVAILANRSAEAYAAVIACYRAGITYVPLNPAFPIARLQKVIQLSGAVECLFDPRHASIAEQLDCPMLPIALDQEDASFSPAAPEPETFAYQLFTSGSTGEPKGVPIPHRALSHYVEHIIEAVGIGDGWRASQFFDLSFDLSMHDIFVTFATGGTLIAAGDIDLMMPHRFVARNQIDIWFSVPMLAVAATRGQAARPEVPRLKKALFCGEALPTEYARAIRSLLLDGGEIWNLYGPTEATIAFTAHRFEEGTCPPDTVPLGSPFGNNVIAVLADDEIRPVNEGAEGELLLGGPQVFAGYQPPVQSPFVSDASGQRFYRTGDLVRLAEGQLRYIGRIDNQVKIRGHRVELGEIEAACRRVDGVDVAIALLLDGTNPRLVLAYEAAKDADFQGLSAALPAYMIPESFHRFDRLPTNANGKIDRKQLKAQLC